MKYSDPARPSPEGEVIAQAAAELYRTQKANIFLIFANTVIGGVRECDILIDRLVMLGVPKGALIVDPAADTTYGEFEAFARYAREHALGDAAVLSIEAKRDRLPSIAKRENFFPTIYWAEDVLWESSDKSLRDFVEGWRHAPRHFLMRVKLGILPIIVMWIDPHARIQRTIARLLRHQK